jgi:hypothetical protein
MSNEGTPSPRDTDKSRWRVAGIVALFLIGILIGRLLAPKCPPCSSSGGGGGSAATRVGTPGHGHPQASPSSADTGAPGAGKLSGSGTGVADQGTGPGADGPGMKVLSGGQAGPKDDSPDTLGRSVDRSSQPADPADPSNSGKLSGNGPEFKDRPDPPPSQVLTASDFRYDKTGLPRYSQSVSTAGSTLTPLPGTGGGYHSTCAIVTTSSFQDVVEWYKTQLPGGWHSQSVGDLNALAQHVSIENIVKTLTAATASNGSAASTVSPVPQNDTALSVAMFSPPAGAAGEPMIMVRQKAGQAVEITLSKNGSDP